MNENRNMTKIEKMLVRVDEALLKAREASVRTDQAIDRAQDAIDRFWEQQEAALARMRGEKKAEQAEEKDAKTEQCEPVGALREAPLQYRHPPIDPNLLVELVSDLLLLAGRMDEQLQAIEKRTRRQKRRRRSAGRFVPPPAF